ncbi:UNVERIFIED_CONTAM: hypothetical protein K2H54_050445 [Gekko kuhli]
MRLRYKKVVALNATSGHEAVTCPFYEELDHILSKSRDIHPEDGILQTRERGRRETETPTPSYEEASQELFSDESQDDSQPSTSSHAVPRTTEEEPGPSHHHNPPQAEHHTIQQEPGQLSRAGRKRLYSLCGVAEKLLEQTDREHAAQLAQTDSQRAECNGGKETRDGATQRGDAGEHGGQGDAPGSYYTA